MFPTLGVRPALGRAFTEGDDREGAPATVVLSDRLWRTLFGADAGVIGRKITLDDRPVTIIGVMGREFSFPTQRAELWLPLVLNDQAFADRNNTYLRAIGRLRPGATVASARTELTRDREPVHAPVPEGEREHRRNGESAPRRARRADRERWYWRSVAPPSV